MEPSSPPCILCKVRVRADEVHCPPCQTALYTLRHGQAGPPPPELVRTQDLLRAVADLQSELHRNLGKVFSRIGRLENALGQTRSGVITTPLREQYYDALIRLADLERQVLVLGATLRDSE